MIRCFGNPRGVTYHHGVGLIDILHPEPGFFRLQTVARALAGKYRWCGTAYRAGEQITVAQHCCAVFDALLLSGHSDHTCKWGLLHELDEVFLPDIPSPLKRAELLSYEWVQLAERHMRAGAEAFGLALPIPGVVHDADKQCAVAEFNAVSGQSTGATAFAGHDFTVPWGPTWAELEFVRRMDPVKPWT